MRMSAKLAATGLAVAMLGIGGVAAHSGRYDTARLARIAGVEMGPGCRAHPESRWCARHYAALARAKGALGRSAGRGVRHDTRRETALANLAELDKVQAAAWDGGPDADPAQAYAANGYGYDAPGYGDAPPPRHGHRHHRHDDCDCGNGG